MLNTPSSLLVRKLSYFAHIYEHRVFLSTSHAVHFGDDQLDKKVLIKCLMSTTSRSLMTGYYVYHYFMLSLIAPLK